MKRLSHSNPRTKINYFVISAFFGLFPLWALHTEEKTPHIRSYEWKRSGEVDRGVFFLLGKSGEKKKKITIWCTRREARKIETQKQADTPFALVSVVVLVNMFRVRTWVRHTGYAIIITIKTYCHRCYCCLPSQYGSVFYCSHFFSCSARA